jgi:hypothetical protein
MTDKYLTKIVAASLLGDGSVGVPPDGSKNAKYRQPKTVDHMDYVDWLSERLEAITKTNRYTWQPKSYPNAKQQVMLQTGCHPFYTSFRNRMYPNGHKVVDPHYLTLIDDEFMAVWYQEDGTLIRDVRPQGTYTKVILCTDCFSYGDNHCLRAAIKEHTGLEFNVTSYRKNGSQYYRLQLNSKQIGEFCSRLEKHVAPSFSYKLCCTVGSTTRVDEDIVRTAKELVDQYGNIIGRGTGLD